jgi:3-methylcrotonyl-CoA carboxylase alpha subunit
VSPFYDPMIAKIIAHAATRGQALDRLARALEQTIAIGPRTNLAFLAALVRAPEFRRGRFDTDFVDRNLASLGAVPRALDRAAAAAGAARLLAREPQRMAAARDTGAPPSPWDADDAFQLSGPRTLSLPMWVDGDSVTAQATYAGGLQVAVDGATPAADSLAIDGPDAVYVLRHGRQTVVKLKDATIDVEHLDGDGAVRAPMHGKLLAILVEREAPVTKGQRLAIIEAMKMEHALLAPIAGRVSEILAAAGNQIAEGAIIMVIAPEQGQ